MRCFLFVNQVSEIGFRQTTALLAAALNRRSVKVVLADFTALSARSQSGKMATNGFTVSGYLLPDNAATSQQVADFASHTNALDSYSVAPTDCLLIRTNPGRDIARQNLHRSFLDLASFAEVQGIAVINSPTHLFRFASKASLLLVDPQHRPDMTVTRKVSEAVAFINDAPCDCVVKPLLGSRGANVIRVSRNTANLSGNLRETFGGDQIIAQHFVEASHAGDRRIVVLDGDILECPTGIAGIERHPAENDFRANLHAGGTAHPLKLTAEDRAAATHAAQLLLRHEIRLAGIDLIGGKIIELNVFSTGGIYDANCFAECDFTDTIASRYLEKPQIFSPSSSSR